VQLAVLEGVQAHLSVALRKAPGELLRLRMDLSKSARQIEGR
jgi:hypothetical protein